MAPAPNWRRAYHEQLAETIEEYRSRRDGTCPGAGGTRIAMRVYLPGLQKSKSVHDLTDREIEDVARAEVETDINRAIHTYNASL